MTYAQRMRLVILPQAFRVTIPPLLGQAIVLVKDSALLSLISVAELTRAGQLLASDRFMPAEGFITTAACYLVLYYGLKGLAALSARWLGLRPIEEPHMIWLQLQSLVGSYPLALARPRHDRLPVADQPGAGHAARLCARHPADRRQPPDQRLQSEPGST